MRGIDTRNNDTKILRETCTYCGMTANLDPQLHHERYAHVPYVARDRVLHGFDYRSYTFQPVTCPECIELGHGCRAHNDKVHTSIDD